MKKKISIFLTLMMMLGIVAPLGIPSYADTGIPGSDFEYLPILSGDQVTTTGDQIIITGYTGDGGEVVIPEEIDGKSVVVIGEEAFSNYYNISKITIPGSVRKIEKYAFKNCYCDYIFEGKLAPEIEMEAFFGLYNYSAFISAGSSGYDSSKYPFVDGSPLELNLNVIVEPGSQPMSIKARISGTPRSHFVALVNGEWQSASVGSEISPDMPRYVSGDDILEGVRTGARVHLYEIDDEDKIVSRFSGRLSPDEINYTSPFAGGTGTMEDPYQIETPKQLSYVGEFAYEKEEKQRYYTPPEPNSFILNNDIDLDVFPYNTGKGWIPQSLGRWGESQCIFDGNGKLIKNMMINTGQQEMDLKSARGKIRSAGLFSDICNAKITNLGIVDANVSGGINTGILSGETYNAHIENVFVTGSVVGDLSVGGMVGAVNYSPNTILNCYSRADVKGSGVVGGLVGFIQSSSIKNSYVVGQVKIENPNTYVSWYSKGEDAEKKWSEYLGALVGADNPENTDENTFRANYYDSDVSGMDDSVAGTGKTSGEMKNKETFLSGEGEEIWDFEDVWAISSEENDGYPYLVGVYPVKKDQAAPSGLKGIAPTSAENNDGKITGVSTEMEYRLKADSDFIKVLGSEIRGLIPGKYEVRYSAQGGFNPSDVVEVSLPEYSSSSDDDSGDHSSSSSRDSSKADAKPGKNSQGVEVLVNGESEAAGSISNSKENGRGKATITVDKEKIEKKLREEGKGAVVTIPIRVESEVVVARLDAEMVRNMETKEAVIEERTANEEYKIEAKQINTRRILDKLGEDVALEDVEIEIKIAKPSTGKIEIVEDSANRGDFKIVAPAIDFSVNYTCKDKSYEIEDFNSYVERLIAIPDGVDSKGITTGIIVEEDGSVRHVPTEVVIKDGRYFAKINSLTNSTYAVIWHPIEFIDVADHWAKEPINDMGSRMVVSGVGGGKYCPDADITRAEFATIVVRGLGLKMKSGESEFKDVDRNDWFYEPVITANEYRIIGGYGDKNFRPNEKITREQAMSIIARAMTITGLDPGLDTKGVEVLLGTYKDGKSSSEYARESIVDCLKTGVIRGRTNDTISPQSYITRAEVAAIIERLLKKSDLI